MKIYVQNHGWDGVIIVTAANMEQASEKMCGNYNYDKDVEIQEFELDNFEYVNLGDC